MTQSIQRQLSLWLTVAIVTAGMVAAATSFFVAYHEASTSQDAQLEQVAAALSRGSFRDVPPESQPHDRDEAEGRFLVSGLGAFPARESGIDLALPANLANGIQTFVQNDAAWRVIVVLDSYGERFGVAQSMEARDEDALAGALYVLAPLALLVPMLLVFVRVLLRRSFAPLIALSTEVDQVDGTRLRSLHIDTVPAEVLPFAEAVNRLVERLGIALEQQRRLVADAAHELRSPLAALMVQAENVQNAPPETAHERLAALRRGLQRMAALHDQLLSFARVQKPEAMDPQWIELDGIVRSTIEELSPLARQKGVDLGCTQLTALRIIGDRRHAASLIRNAIDNAVRYTPSGGSVDVSLAHEDDSVYFVVEDSGPGIAPEDLPRVFEPFVRILGTRESGSGLGLAIVQAAAQAMGGTVELGGRADHRPGLRFVYRQPVSQP